MAGIDKIYGTKDDWKELTNWIILNKIELLSFLYDMPIEFGALSNFPKIVDRYLLAKCPLDFVKNRLLEQYQNIEPNKNLNLKGILRSKVKYNMSHRKIKKWLLTNTWIEYVDNKKDRKDYIDYIFSILEKRKLKNDNT